MIARRLGLLPPLPPTAALRRGPHDPPFPLEDPGSSLHAWGRHALWHGLRGLLRKGDQVLVPAWHHGSEVEILHRLGAQLRFYDCGPELEPNPQELESLLTGSTRALHLTHYVGFPLRAARWREWADAHDLLLIEDVAQAWLGSDDGRPLGSFGQVAIFCLYKSFGLPDGAVCLNRATGPSPEPGTRRAGRRLAHKHAAWLAQRLPLPARRHSSEGYSTERDFALGDPGMPMAAGTVRLLSRVSDPRAAAQRRDNYARLLESLREHVCAGFERVPQGAAPFAFPLRVRDKQGALQRLYAAGVLAVDFWSVPHQLLEPERFPEADRRRNETIGLPVHQELRPRDLECIAEVALAASS